MDDSEKVLFKDFDEAFDNKKEEKQEIEKTGLNKDNIPIINIPTQGDIIVLINNSDNDRIEKSRKRPKYIPIQKRQIAIQTDCHQNLSEDESQQVNEPKSSPAEDRMKNIHKNKVTALIQKISQLKYLGRKTKKNSPKKIKANENIQGNGNSELIQEKNENNYSNKNKENINQNKANVNKENIYNTGLKNQNNINNYKLSFVNSTHDKNHKQNNYNNYIAPDIRIKEEKELFDPIEKYISYLPNLHDSQDFLDFQKPLDFHEEERIFQNDLNNYFGY